jgi:hypothetical protein
MIAETKHEIAKIVRPGAFRARRQKIPATIINTKSNACTYGVNESRTGIKFDDAVVGCAGCGRIFVPGIWPGSFIGVGIGRAPTPAGALGIMGIAGGPGMSLGREVCGPIPGGNEGGDGNVGALRGAGGDG